MRMLAQILACDSDQLYVLTLVDHDRDRPSDASGFVATCCGGSKSRFCLEAFRLSRAGVARATIVGHPAFLPLAWVLHRLKLIDRYILVLHGIEAWCRLPWIYRVAARQASTVVTTTKYTAREFCFHNGMQNGNVAVVPLASTFSFPAIRRSPPTTELKLLTITRLSVPDSSKGVDTILIAIRQARQAGLEVTLDVVGSGNDKPRLEKLACFLNIQDAVRFHGAVSDQHLEQFFRNSHVFVLPSRIEGFGIVFLEAMAAGLPCIGANHGGTPEVIRDGETGFLIEHDDVGQLAFCWRRFMESPELYELMSDAARRRATETLSFEVMAQSWMRLAAGLVNWLDACGA